MQATFSRSVRATISRRYELQCAHWLPRVGADHKCHRLHGHTYSVTVSVTDDTDPERGWFMDFAELDAAWAPIFALLDHRLLNDVMENPTTELLAAWIGELLAPAIIHLAPGAPGREMVIAIAENSRAEVRVAHVR